MSRLIGDRGQGRGLNGRSRQGDRGAVMVEMALVLPLLLLLVFGIIDFSLAMKDKASVASSVRVGARIASTGADAGPGICPDPPDPHFPCSPTRTPLLAQAAADAIATAGTAMPKDSIEEIWVYRYKDSFGSAPPVACVTDCVIYRWNAGADRFQYKAGTWVSSTIDACLNDPSAMSVGVYMRAAHDFVSPFFGASVHLTDFAVMKFEPLPNLQCRPGDHA